MRLVQTGLTFTILPEVHLRTLVWIHGLGDTGELFAQDFYQSALIPDCKVVLPTAPISAVSIYPGEKMTSWYDIKGDLGYDPSMDLSASFLCELLTEESKLTPNLYIGGFSQGAVMSLYTGLCKYQGDLKAIIALSGYAVPMSVSPHKLNTPVLMYHGAQDQRIPLEHAQVTAQNYLSQADLTFEVHPTMPHEVYAEEYDYISKWVTKTL